MHLTLSTSCQALFLLVSCGPAFGRLVTKKRDVCVNDDYLLSFVQYPSDTVPFCKMYLGIEDVTTSVVSATSRTTLIETATTINTVVQTITVPAFTEYGTTTVVQLRKRGPQPTDAALAIKDLGARDNTPQNSAIISGVSSACSCLHIVPNTVILPATAYTTRTEEAIDYQKVIDLVTVTGGTTTVLATLISSSDTSSGPTPWNLTTVPTIPLSTGTIYSTSTPLTTISTIITISTSTGTVSPISSASSEVPTGPPSEYSTVSWPISMPTSSAVSGTVIPSLNSTFVPKTGSTVAPNTDSSSIITGTSSSFPTTASGIILTIPTMLNLTTLTYGLSSKPSASIPISSSIATISGSPAYPPTNTNMTSSKPPHPTPTNATSTSSGLPEPNPTATGCPAINGSILAYSNQHFLVICNRDYGGSTTIGLDEPNFRACVQQCAITNNGFSSARCRGVTFFPNTTGTDCYLKTAAAVAAPEDDPTAISALLINTTLPISSMSTSTPSASPSNSMNYSSAAGPTAPSSGFSSFIPSLTSNFSTSAGPTGLSSTRINATSAFTTSSITPLSISNSSSTASITPSLSFNSTNIASMTPTISYNGSFTLNTTGTEWKTTSVPTNSTLCASPTEMVTSTSVTVVTSTSTVSVTTTIPWWKF